MATTPLFSTAGGKSTLMTAVAGVSLALLTACGAPQSSQSETSSPSASATGDIENTQGATGAHTAHGESPTASPVEGVSDAVNAGYALNTVGDLPVVTMYTDYECPACQSAHPVVTDAAEQLDGTVAVVVKNYPLKMHQNALPAAHAVEAAAMQDYAPEFADHLYSNAEEWAQLSEAELDKYFITLAEDLGLDHEQFERDQSSEAVAQIVEAHREQAADLDLKGTPSFVVADELVDLENVRSADDLATAFEEATAAAGDGAKLPAGGSAAPTPRS